MDSGHLVKVNASALREVTPANLFQHGSSGPPLAALAFSAIVRPPRISAGSDRAEVDRDWVHRNVFTVVAIASLRMTPI